MGSSAARTRGRRRPGTSEGRGRGRRDLVRAPGSDGSLHGVALADARREFHLHDGSAWDLYADVRRTAVAGPHPGGTRNRRYRGAASSGSSAGGVAEGGGRMPVMVVPSVGAGDAVRLDSAAPEGIARAGFLSPTGKAIFPPARGLASAALALDFSAPGAAPLRFGFFEPRFSSSASSAKYASRLRRAASFASCVSSAPMSTNPKRATDYATPAATQSVDERDFRRVRVSSLV